MHVHRSSINIGTGAGSRHGLTLLPMVENQLNIKLKLVNYYEHNRAWLSIPLLPDPSKLYPTHRDMHAMKVACL